MYSLFQWPSIQITPTRISIRAMHFENYICICGHSTQHMDVVFLCNYDFYRFVIIIIFIVSATLQPTNIVVNNRQNQQQHSQYHQMELAYIHVCMYVYVCKALTTSYATSSTYLLFGKCCNRSLSSSSSPPFSSLQL